MYWLSSDNELETVEVAESVETSSEEITSRRIIDSSLALMFWIDEFPFDTLISDWSRVCLAGQWDPGRW